MSRLLFLLLAACSYEYGVSGKPDVNVVETDTGETVVDTDPPADSDTTEPTDTADGTQTLPADSGDTTDTTPPEDTDPPPADDCVDSSDLIYVISRDDGSLYLFDPPSLSFTVVAKPKCNTSQTPSSMAVSRDGHAFVRYYDDRVFDVDLATNACTATGYSDRQTGFGSFGMGYSTDSSKTWRDQLYIANSKHLAVLDTSTWQVTQLGTVPSQSELTGNAAGELWAFLPLERPAQLVELDKTNGSALQTLKLPGFPAAANIDTFAFATWKGEFWLFVRESGMGNHTDVYKVDASGTLTKEKTNIGFDVVGAGVSTCAPTN